MLLLLWILLLLLLLLLLLQLLPFRINTHGSSSLLRKRGVVILHSLLLPNWFSRQPNIKCKNKDVPLALPSNPQQLICHPALLCYSITAGCFRTVRASSGLRCLLAIEFILSGVRACVVLEPGHRERTEHSLREGGQGLFRLFPGFSLLSMLIFMFRKQWLCKEKR